MLAVIGILQVNADVFKNLLSEMCIAFRGPVTIFCYLCVAFLLYLVCSKKGKIVIGGKDAKKEYSDFSWLSCLFMAGCGIGIVFYCQEPILHLYNNPYTGTVKGGAEEIAYSLTLFNWTINA
ncbi:MAG: BCCT family transporter, partial [Alistipes sp.]|nr:BCCT family transporter [Alistipes sp.]